MYCKFCEKDALEESLCTTCGKTTVDRLGAWSRYSPALVWPVATWLVGFVAYRLVIAFQPAIAPRFMRGLVVAVLIVLAKGIWSTYCRHAFHAPIRPGSKPTVLESDKRRIIGGIAGTVKPLEPEVSDKTNLDNVEPSMER